MARDRVLDDREAEAGAARIARTAAVHAVEALGQPRQVLCGNADTRVLHREGRALREIAPDEAYLAVARRIADGVGHQVAECARELALGAEEVDRGGALQADAVPACGERLAVGEQAPQ